MWRQRSRYVFVAIAVVIAGIIAGIAYDRFSSYDMRPRPRITNGVWVDDPVTRAVRLLPEGFLNEEYLAYESPLRHASLQSAVFNFNGSRRRIWSIWLRGRSEEDEVRSLLELLEADLGSATASGHLAQKDSVRACRWDSEKWWAVLTWIERTPQTTDLNEYEVALRIYSVRSGVARWNPEYQVEVP
jgi:hypothetical protein